MYTSTSSTRQSKIPQISSKVAVEMFRLCFKESSVPRLKLCSLISVYVVIFFLRMVSHSGW